MDLRMKEMNNVYKFLHYLKMEKEQQKAISFVQPFETT